MPSDGARTIGGTSEVREAVATVPPAMPIYEYVCMSCESRFEELVRPDETPDCPECGAKKVQRQLSVFAAHGSAKSSVGSSAAKPGFGGPSLGGCGSGSCGCGHN